MSCRVVLDPAQDVTVVMKGMVEDQTDTRDPMTFTTDSNLSQMREALPQVRIDGLLARVRDTLTADR